MKRVFVTIALLLLLPASPAGAASQHRSLPRNETRAVEYARRHGMASGIAVVDTRTGRIYAAGESHRLFAAASVVKTLIATRLILRGKLHGHDRRLARVMITKSDNDAATRLYPKVGGRRLVPMLERHYGIDKLGRPTRTTGPLRWGNTRLTARGLATLYAAIRHDRRVWPWLSRAMHAYRRYSAAGEPNDFGIAAAAPKSAVKNGWVLDREPHQPVRTQINTTGFVDHDRFAIVILSRGATSLYYRRGERIVSAEARRIAEHGRIMTPGLR